MSCLVVMVMKDNFGFCYYVSNLHPELFIYFMYQQGNIPFLSPSGFWTLLLAKEYWLW